MNVIDSSGWLEYFAEGKNADFFVPPILELENVIVPVICIYEVFKVIVREKNKSAALLAVAVMQQAEIIDINQDIALSAAELSLQKKIPIADSFIYTIARKRNAILWTQDSDFKELPEVEYIAK